MSKNKEYDIYRITLDEYTTYDICVPKDQLEEFEKWKESKDVIVSEWVGETDDDAVCCTVFDHGYEFPDECDDSLYLEEEDEEEIEKVEEEADEICRKVTSCEDCPSEVCGDWCEILCEEEEEMEEDMEDLEYEEEE